MIGAKTFLKSGHAPTLFASFLYFDFCFAIWVLNGAMAPFISESFGLTPAQKGFMISVPILAGAIMRFPLGVMSQYIGRKNAALVEMGMILAAMIYGYLFVETYHDVLRMGILLGLAGASFGVALSLGSGWFPAKYKGLAMGIAGAGNSGTVLAVLFAPPLATHYGWKTVYGFAAIFMTLPFFVMLFLAKEPPDREKQSFREHIACLWEKDGWIFNFIYIITFGGFIGLSNFLPTYYHDQFGVSKIEAGQLTMLAALMGSGVRVVGGWISDRWGGVNTLTLMFGVIIVTMFASAFPHDLVTTTLLFMVCFAALGAGNGALFQLVPLRWPVTTAVAGSMIGEVGALGGGFIPNAMGQSKQHLGTFSWGFLSFSVLAVGAVLTLRLAQRRWTRTWVGEGGRAKVLVPAEPVESIQYAPIGVTVPMIANGVTYRNIVLPVGGNSELADEATRQAAYLARASGAKLIVVYVEEKSRNIAGLTTDSPQWQKVKEEWIEEGQKILYVEEQRLRGLDVVEVEKVLREGNMADEVAAVAEEHHADLIVLASSKRSPMGRLLMGSHTYNLFTKAPCPILRIVR